MDEQITNELELFKEFLKTQELLPEELQNFKLSSIKHQQKPFLDCNLRRTAATGAFASGHPAEPNGHLH